MKLYYETGGGFVGLVKIFECDSSALPPNLKPELEALTTFSVVGDSQKHHGPYQFLKIDNGANTSEWRFGDDVPQRFRALFLHFEQNAAFLKK